MQVLLCCFWWTTSCSCWSTKMHSTIAIYYMITLQSQEIPCGSFGKQRSGNWSYWDYKLPPETSLSKRKQSTRCRHLRLGTLPIRNHTTTQLARKDRFTSWIPTSSTGFARESLTMMTMKQVVTAKPDNQFAATGLPFASTSRNLPRRILIVNVC